MELSYEQQFGRARRSSGVRLQGSSSVFCNDCSVGDCRHGRWRADCRPIGLARSERDLGPLHRLWPFAAAAHQRRYLCVWRLCAFRDLILRGTANKSGALVGGWLVAFTFRGWQGVTVLAAIQLPLGTTLPKE